MFLIQLIARLLYGKEAVEEFDKKSNARPRPRPKRTRRKK